MAAAPFKLYGEPYSVSTLPVIFTAVEGGVPYELQVVHLDHGEHLKPEFRAINPVISSVQTQPFRRNGRQCTLSA
eukprot:166134-Rhodomonas_salina.3